MLEFSVAYTTWLGALSGMFGLVYWPAEDSVSVVKLHDVLNPENPVVGCECVVKVANHTYDRKLAALGKCH